MRARSNWLFRPKVKATWVAIAAGSLVGLAVLGACSDAPISKIAGPNIPDPRFVPGQVGANAREIELCVDPLSSPGTYAFSVATAPPGSPYFSFLEPVSQSDPDFGFGGNPVQTTDGPWTGDKLANSTTLASATVTLGTPGSGAPGCATVFQRATTTNNLDNRLWTYNPNSQTPEVVNRYATIIITPPGGATYTADCENDEPALPQTAGCRTGPIAATTIFSSANVFHGSTVTYKATAQLTGPCPLPNGAFGLGAAAPFTFLGLAGNNIDVGSSATYVLGNFGLGPNNTGVMKKATIDGDLTKDPTSTVTVTSDLKVLGSTFNLSLVTASNDATLASATLGALTPDQSLNNVTGSQTFTTLGGTKVIAINSVNVTGKTFTIVGDGDDVFIFNVAGAFSFRNSQMILSGGVLPTNIIWNFTGGTGDVAVKDPSTRGFGIFLAPDRNFTGDKATIVGAVMVGQRVILHSGTQLLCE